VGSVARHVTALRSLRDGALLSDDVESVSELPWCLVWQLTLVLVYILVKILAAKHNSATKLVVDQTSVVLQRCG
jgi:hypothetical protein